MWTDPPPMDQEAGHVGRLVTDDLQEQVLGRELQNAGADSDLAGSGKSAGQGPGHAATGANVNPGLEVGSAPYDRQMSEQRLRARGQLRLWARQVVGGTAASKHHDFPCSQHDSGLPSSNGDEPRGTRIRPAATKLNAAITIPRKNTY